MSAVLAPRVEIRPMRHADIDQILAIEESVYPFPWTRGNFVDSMVAGYGCCAGWVAGQLFGYYVLMLALDEAHLLNVSVAEGHQGTGFGARLLRHALCEAGRGGATTLLLEVRRSNDRALTLYRHFGFQQIGVRRAYYAAEGGREDALVLRRALGEVSA